MATINLAVIIVSYNTHDLLQRCVQSVLASAAPAARQLHVDVLVVDNASSDGSAAMIAREFPQVRLLAQQENLGFTGANNLALRMLGFGIDDSGAAAPAPLDAPAQPDFVLLLNPDTEIVGDALWQMTSFLREHPNAGACGAHLSYGDGRFQHGAFRFPTLAQVALDLLPLSSLPGAARLYDGRINGRYAQEQWQGEAPFAVDFVLGAAIMVRRGAIEQVGALDQGYFMYCEEMDWCVRLQRAGWAVFALPQAKVVHFEGQSSRQRRWSSFVQLWRSRYRFYAKHAQLYWPGYVWAVRLLTSTSLSILARRALRQYARGQISGVEIAEELRAYRAVRAL